MLLKCEQTVFCSYYSACFANLWNTWGRPDRRRLNCFPTFMQTRREISCTVFIVSLVMNMCDRWSIKDSKVSRLFWLTSGLFGGTDWCPVKLSVFSVLLLWISPDQTTRESRESPLPAGGRLSCCLWNIMCAVNEKVAVLDWAGGFLDTRRHRLMFSLLRWLCCVAVSGTGPDGPELLSAASGPSAAEVRILLINSRLHQHQGSPCAPCCWGFISSRCNKLSQNSRLCDPEAVCSSLLSGSVCCFPAWCSSAPHRILHLLPCERCCSHFLPLHLLLLLMLLCQLCWSVRCLSEL